MRESIQDIARRHFEVIAEPVRRDLETIAREVAREFRLEDAPSLVCPRGPHRLSEAKGAVIVLALEFLPVTRLVLAALYACDESAIYRSQASARLLAKGNAEFAARMKTLRERLPKLLTRPRRVKRKGKSHE